MRKCRQCRAEIPSIKNSDFYQKSNFCNNEHMAQYGLAKAVKNRETAASKQLRADKESIKPARKWKAEAQAEFNRFIRVRDFGDPCISCGKSREEVEREQGWKLGGAWDAGHFKSRGAKGQLRFNTFNCHKQCKSCNGGSKYSHKEASVSVQYKENLIKKIGLERVQWLENNNDSENSDIEYLKRVKKIFAKRKNLYRKLKSIN